MRKLILLFFGIFLAGSMLQAQVGITFTFANGTIVNEGADNYYEFDVMAAASESGTRIGTGIVLINYNTNAFGTSVDINGNAVATKGTLIDVFFGPLAVYNLLHNDNSPSRVAFTFEYAQSEGYGSELPTSPTQLMHVRFKILDTSETAGLSFGTGMIDQQYYDDNSTIYDPVVINDTDDSPLPVILSSFICTYINSTPTISWVTQSETENLGWNIYRSVSENFGQALQANSELIPGAGTTTEPTYYLFEDLFEYTSDTSYWYWLETISQSGEFEQYGPTLLYIPEDEEGPDIPDIPGKYGLYQNYPNPFNPATEFSFALKQDSQCELTIYNSKGRIVKELFSGNVLADRIYRFNWEGDDASGSKACSGVYFYELKVNGKVHEVKKCILMK